MANRFNALFIMCKHLDEHGRFHFAYATIRPADHGINATEWERGVRTLQHDHPSQPALERFLSDNYYEVLDIDAWSEMIDSLGDGTDVPNNNFVSTRVYRDKWLPEITIY